MELKKSTNWKCQQSRQQKPNRILLSPVKEPGKGQLSKLENFKILSILLQSTPKKKPAPNPTYANKEVESLDFYPHKNGNTEKDNRSAINTLSIRGPVLCVILVIILTKKNIQSFKTRKSQVKS